ncbi:2-oxoglutaroyl-CoA hydrolase [Paraburkholderia sp. GAS199]|uniref:enoyl-CoA hydratase/isomerase family protein n=1 Tax=Paraburkholderia sp. GAS199 TaxID=3035126 RepID=UPI003D1FEFAB
MTCIVAEDRNLWEYTDGLHVQIDEAQSRADLVLDRALSASGSAAQYEQVRHVFDDLDTHPGVRVIVVRVEGDHFSTGSDVGCTAMQQAWDMNAPARCRKLVIAVNRGHCFGAAFGFSLACDLRIVTETTVYALAQPLLSSALYRNCTALLSHIVGPGRAKDIALRSRYISSAAAYEWGIATEFAPDCELNDAIDAVVTGLISVPPDVQLKTKQFFSR